MGQILVDIWKSILGRPAPLYNVDYSMEGVDQVSAFMRSDTGYFPALRALCAAGVPDAHACIVSDLNRKLAYYRLNSARAAVTGPYLSSIPQQGVI